MSKCFPTIFTMTAQASELTPDISAYKARTAKNADGGEINRLIDECNDEIRKVCAPKACYTIIETRTGKEETAFGDVLRIKSKRLASVLKNCDRTVIFAATVGFGIDRVTAKYSAASPLKAWLCQGIGAMYIEAWCDLLCARITENEGMYMKPRYSPGYGDLPIEIQSELSQLLCIQKRCGITMTDKFIMLPTKSVTAFLGLSKTPFCPVNKCSMCSRTECDYRND